MRIKVLAIALLATVAMLQSVSQAAFISSGNLILENVSPNPVAKVQGQLFWEVWGPNSTAYGLSLGVGEYGYFYQVQNQSPSQSIETFSIAGSYSTSAEGVINGLLLDDTGVGGPGTTVAAGAGTLRPMAFDNTGSEIFWNFQPAAITTGAYSDIMFFVAGQSFGLANVGQLLFPPTASGMVPVPVPVPPAIFLALAGLPFLRALGRKK